MARALVILLAFFIDLAWGDPPNRFHPLLLMGRWLTWGRRLAPARQRFWFGAGWTLAGAALFSLPWRLSGSANQRVSEATPTSEASNLKTHNSKLITHNSKLITISPLLLKPLFAYRNLRRAVLEVAAALAAGDLVEGRRLLSWHLVSRDTGQLTAAEVAGATIESLAENLTDSLAAPLLAYAVGGLPAAWAYRFVNTADAMWGYRTAEFEQLGKFPARLDDALNWLPARLVGWLMVAAAWLSGEDAGQAARTMLAQHGRTSSPNAGWTMTAMAGAMRVSLTKRGVYELTGGSAPLDAPAIRRALRLADYTAGLIVVSAVLAALLVDRRGSAKIRVQIEKVQRY